VIDGAALAGAVALLTSSWQAWIWVIPGLLIGLFFGAMPGVSVSMAMALVLPPTLYMDFLPAIIFLTSVYTGAGFGGSVPAVLMNIPGTSSAVATTFDGYPMARQGRHNEALGLALFASCLGVLFSYAILFVLISPMADAVLRIGPVEMLVVAVWGMLLLGSLGSRYLTRGLMAAAFGVLLGTVGMNTAGYMRGTMGVPWLLDGIPVIPAMMGLLAASQLLNLVNARYLVEAEEDRRISARRIVAGCALTLRHPGVLLRGSVIGAIIGAIPGVGSSISNLLSYAETKRTDPEPDSFGQGNPKGVIAAEAANSSSEGGSMATMLALGIPGGGATAILLAAFAMHNIVGGPSFIDQNKHVVYAIILSNFAQAVLLLLVGFGFIFVASSIVRVPLRLLVPAVLLVAAMGSYAIDGTTSGPITLFVFAVIGWGMSRYEYPVAAVVVGLLLGRMLETQALRSYQLSIGHPFYFLERPVALVLLALMVGSLGLTAWQRARAGRAAATQGAA
jgi:putative tricarboxylic transport membrane protein